MEIKTYLKEEQAYGEFNGGAIVENKPIGFPQDGGNQKPYSNLFYWAHAYSEQGSLIGLHQHKGFEIISFILKGNIEHYDTAHKEWKRLGKGDIQIIRSGSGISHSEKFLPDSGIFQIWFDPDFSKTMTKEASYNDYRYKDFPLTQKEGYTVIHYKEDGSPLQMDSCGVSIKQYSFEKGEFTLNADENRIYSLYVIAGAVRIDANDLKQDSFSVIKKTKEINLEATKESNVFIIENPLELDYKTYS